MSDKLSLSLPERPQKISKANILVLVLLALLTMVSATSLVLLLRGQSGRSEESARPLSKETYKELAVKLESQELFEPALDAWKSYLDMYSLSERERALIYYRIGVVYQRTGNYEKALAAYYQSEAIFSDESVAGELNARVQKSLESLGKYAALRSELGERTSVDQNKTQDDVVATIGALSITRMDLDRLIEELIESQLAAYAGTMSREEMGRQKEALFSRYATQETRQAILESYLAEEMLSTKARQLELHLDPSIQRMLERTERGILAQALVRMNLDENVRISDVDVENHYRANSDLYVQPERARIQHILLSDERKAGEVHARALSGESFADLAAAYSEDQTTSAKGGELEDWALKGNAIPGIGFSIDAITTIFSTDAGQVCKELVSADNGYHIIRVIERQPERQKSFDEVRDEVRAQLYSVKQEEVQAGLMEVLRKEYDVVLFPDNIATDDQE